MLIADIREISSILRELSIFLALFHQSRISTHTKSIFFEESFLSTNKTQSYPNPRDLSNTSKTSIIFFSEK